MRQHEVARPKGSRKSRRRLGRGTSQGQGKTAGRGTKGQLARTTWASWDASERALTWSAAEVKAKRDFTWFPLRSRR